MPPSTLSVQTFDYTPRFQRDLKKASPEIKAAANAALKALQENPSSGVLRLEKLQGYKKPSIYTIHATSNHSHKISFELQGTHAILRRLGTHKEIDDAP